MALFHRPCSGRSVRQHRSQTGATSPWPMAGCLTDWSEERRSWWPTSRFSINEGPQFGSNFSRFGSRGTCCQDRDCRRVETIPKKRWRPFVWIQMPRLSQPGRKRSNGGFQGAQDGHSRESVETCAERCTRAAIGRIERSRKRAHHDEERAAEILRLEESEERLEELRAMQRAQPLPSTPVADASTEVAHLQQMVMELQKQLHPRSTCDSIPHSEDGRIRPGHRAGSDGVDDRQTGGHECSASVWESFRSGAHLRFDHRGDEKSPTCCSFPVHGDQRGEVMGVPRRIESRFGLSGIRVGEASNPGPPRLSSRREVRPHSQDSAEQCESDIHFPPSEELLDALQEDLLARPSQEGRGGEWCTTMTMLQQAIFQKNTKVGVGWRELR